MDELTLLKDRAATTPLPSDDDLAPARARLLAKIATARATVPAPRRWRRLVLVGAAVTGLAAALTGVVALGGLEPVGVVPAQASAAEILHLAAEEARTLPDTPPRADQFIYTKTQIRGEGVREAWLSADGTRDGLIIQRGETIPLAGCRDGQEVVVKGDQFVPGMMQPCEPSPAYRADLPTDADGMRQYLIDLGGAPGPNSLGSNIHGLVAETYVRPPALAAIFDAVAELNGLEVVENVTDSAGRPGVGVRWKFDGHSNTMVFNRQTYAYLGWTDSGAVTEQAIVDTAGQRP